MEFVDLEDLPILGRVSIFILCIGNGIFLLAGATAIFYGSYYISDENIIQFLATYLTGAHNDLLKTLLDSNLSQIILSCCVMLIAVGIGISIICAVGFCGSITRNPHCILGYIMFLVILVVAQIAAMATYYTLKERLENNAEVAFRAGLIPSLYNFGREPESDIVAYTVLFDYIQMKFECCGISGAKDYYEQPILFGSWLNDPWSSDAIGGKKKIAIPPFCCKFGKQMTMNDIIQFESTKNISYEDIKSVFKNFLKDGTCLDDSIPNPDKAWTDQGCHKQFTLMMFNQLLGSMAAIFITIFVLMVICLGAACALSWSISYVKRQRDQEEENEASLRTERDTFLTGIRARGSVVTTAGPQMSTAHLPRVRSSFHAGGRTMSQQNLASLRAMPSTQAGIRAMPSMQAGLRAQASMHYR